MNKFLLLTFLLLSSTVSASSKLVFVELTVTNSPRAKTFYGKIFDWKFTKRSPKFEIIEGLGLPAGMLEVPEADQEQGKNVKLFFQVSNIKAKLKEIEQRGGKTYLSPTDVGTSWIAEFTDPEGNVMGLSCDKPCR